MAVMLLWNWLIPTLFDGKMINYWQALGILVLARLLTGFNKIGSHHWKQKMRHRWDSLSEDEKGRLREKFKDKWCGTPQDEQ